MSTYTQQKVQADPSTEEQPLRPAVREAMQRIALVAAGDPTALISDRSISFQNYAERTTISVTPVGIETYDGQRLTEIIEIRTPLTKFKLFDEELYSSMNVFTTTGAIVRGDDGKDAIVSRVHVFEEYDAALTGLYAPLIANAAAAQVIGVYYGFARSQREQDEITAAKIGQSEA